MGHDAFADQFFNTTPPRDGTCVNLAVTTVVAHTDLTTLNLFGAYDAHKTDHVFVTLIADGGDVYINFSPANVDIDTTTTGQATKVSFLLPQGLPVSFRISKQIDKVLNYIAATGTPHLRLYGSSHKSQSGVGSQ